jgi:putative redox protein
MGIIRDPDFPPSLDEWAQEGQRLSPVEWVSDIAPRPLLLLHGDADDTVHPDSVHALFERAGKGKELRMLPGVGHRFRQEPAAIATALEWLKERFLIPG